jgi:hypothetical protein
MDRDTEDRPHSALRQFGHQLGPAIIHRQIGGGDDLIEGQRPRRQQIAGRGDHLFQRPCEPVPGRVNGIREALNHPVQIGLTHARLRRGGVG